jgi:hypothetical protein
MCVYRKGAEEVVKRLDAVQQWQDANGPAADLEGATVESSMF